MLWSLGNQILPTCLDTSAADLLPGQRDVLGLGLLPPKGSLLPCKAGTTAGFGGKQQGRGGQSIPSASPRLDQLGQEPLSRCIPTHSCLAWRVLTSRLPGFLYMVFSFFFGGGSQTVWNYKGIKKGHRKGYRKAFHGRIVILQIPSQPGQDTCTRHKDEALFCKESLSWQYSRLDAELRRPSLFLGGEKTQLFEKGGEKSMCWGAAGAGEQHPAWMRGAQDGRPPQQAAREVIWAETHTLVRLLWCGAGAKALGERTFFGEAGIGLLLRCCCSERVQPDSSTKGERRGSTTFASPLLPETSEMQSPHLSIISPSASSPCQPSRCSLSPLTFPRIPTHSSRSLPGWRQSRLPAPRLPYL